MHNLLLLGNGFVENEKRYLYVLEMSKRKIVRIVKFDKGVALWENWKKGMITDVESITPWDLEEGTFITSRDKLSMSHPVVLEKVLLNTASYPDNIISCKNNNLYGLIRLSDIYIEPQEHCLQAKIWAWKDEQIILDVDNKRWNSFWNLSESEDKAEIYSKMLNSQRRKLFAVIKSSQEKPVIMDFLVM